MLGLIGHVARVHEAERRGDGSSPAAGTGRRAAAPPFRSTLSRNDAIGLGTAPCLPARALASTSPCSGYASAPLSLVPRHGRAMHGPCTGRPRLWMARAWPVHGPSMARLWRGGRDRAGEE